MSVGETRRALDTLRRRWRESSETVPFFLCDHVFKSMRASDFAFQFVRGQHVKRHRREPVNDA